MLSLLFLLALKERGNEIYFGFAIMYALLPSSVHFLGAMDLSMPSVGV